ncbi:MAG: sugar phosphate isomerase/epimerase [Clostridia bacterium]|nr:sugar phosphate isomerase/epimerase [Clostridia bacterium]
MKLCTTTGDFSLHAKDDFEKVLEISLAGFKYVDFSMYDNETSVYMHDGWRETIKKLKGYADNLGVKFVQAHSPAFETLETLDPNENWQEKFEQTLRSIEICKELDIPVTVVHAGVKRNSSKEETFELNKKFYDLLLPTMEKTGVTVLVENVGINDNNGRYYFNSGKRLAEFIDYYDHPLLQACFDFGHGNAFNNNYNDVICLGERLKAIHYNDNNGVTDMHTIPFLSTLDNNASMKALIDINYSGYFTFECTGAVKSKIKNFDNVNGLGNLSLDVIRAYEKVLYQTGKYLLSAYNVFEE